MISFYTMELNRMLAVFEKYETDFEGRNLAIWFVETDQCVAPAATYLQICLKNSLFEQNFFHMWGKTLSGCLVWKYYCSVVVVIIIAECNRQKNSLATPYTYFTYFSNYQQQCIIVGRRNFNLLLPCWENCCFLSTHIHTKKEHNLLWLCVSNTTCRSHYLT